MHGVLLSVAVEPVRGRKRYAVAYVRVAAGLRLPPREVAIRALMAVGVRLTDFAWNLSAPLDVNTSLYNLMTWRGDYIVDATFEWRRSVALAAGAADGAPPVVRTAQYPERGVCLVELAASSKTPRTALRELLAPLDVEVVWESTARRAGDPVGWLAAAASERGGLGVAVASEEEVAAAVARPGPAQPAPWPWERGGNASS